VAVVTIVLLAVEGWVILAVAGVRAVKLVVEVENSGLLAVEVGSRALPEAEVIENLPKQVQAQMIRVDYLPAGADRVFAGSAVW